MAWPIGIPAMLGLFMHSKRKLIQAEDEDTLKLLDFAVGDYTAECWMWELVEIARKLVLAGLIGLFQRGSVAQTVSFQTQAKYFPPTFLCIT